MFGLFGFIGFDEVTCMVAESHNPTRNVPLAVLITITTVTALYVAASLVLPAWCSTIYPNEGGFPSSP